MCRCSPTPPAQVGDPQVRHRGTIGGSLSHGDPASDLPAVAARPRRHARGRRARAAQREIPADDFFTGFLETALAPDELLTEIRVPKAGGAGWSFQKFNRRAQDWAIVGVAAVAQRHRPGIGLVNMGSTPLRAAAVEQAAGRGARRSPTPPSRPPRAPSRPPTSTPTRVPPPPRPGARPPGARGRQLLSPGGGRTQGVAGHGRAAEACHAAAGVSPCDALRRWRWAARRRQGRPAGAAGHGNGRPSAAVPA